MEKANDAGEKECPWRLSEAQEAPAGRVGNQSFSAAALILTIRPRANQAWYEKGVAHRSAPPDDVTIWCKTQSQIVQENKYRLQCIRKTLNYTADRQDAIEYLRKTYAELSENVRYEQSGSESKRRTPNPRRRTDLITENGLFSLYHPNAICLSFPAQFTFGPAKKAEFGKKWQKRA